MMIRQPAPHEPGRMRLEGLRDRRRHLRTDLALHLLQGTRPPNCLALIINQIRRTELELETGALPAF